MKKVLIIFFLLISGVVSAKDETYISPQDTAKYPVILKLKDKTTVRGTFISEDSKVVVIQSSVGKLEILKENIISLERTFMKYYRITMKDGSVFLGGVIKEDDQEIQLHSSVSGDLKIPVANIQKKETITDESASESSFPNPHSTRYLFGPSAIPIEKNDIYYQNIYLLYNSVHVGISDNLTIGGGVVFPVAAFLTPKISYEVGENFYLGAGALVGATIITATTFGVGYGLATIGNREHNMTLGGGYAYLGSDIGNSPIITISGMSRLGRNVSLVSENWIFKTDYEDKTAILSLSVRVLGRQNSVDLGIVSYYNEFYSDGFWGIPFLGYVYKFGHSGKIKNSSLFK